MATQKTSPLSIPDRMPVEQYRQLIAKKLIGQKKNGVSQMIRKASPEEDLHRLCFQWISLQQTVYPVLAYLTHVPNGGMRSKGEAGKLKAMGTRPGVPDFLLPRSLGNWKGLAIELKSETGKLTPEQKFWLEGLESEGYLVSTCRSFETFEKLIMAFLKNQPSRGCIERGWR